VWNIKIKAIVTKSGAAIIYIGLVLSKIFTCRDDDRWYDD